MSDPELDTELAKASIAINERIWQELLDTSAMPSAVVLGLVMDAARHEALRSPEAWQLFHANCIAASYGAKHAVTGLDS